MKKIQFTLLACLFSFITFAQGNFTKNFQSKEGGFTFTYPSYLSAQKIENAPHMLLKLDSDNHSLTISKWGYGFDSSVSVWDNEIVNYYKDIERALPNTKMGSSCEKIYLIISNNKRVKCLKSEYLTTASVQGYTMKTKTITYRFVHKGNYLQFLFFVMNYHNYWDKLPFTDEIMKGLLLE